MNRSTLALSATIAAIGLVVQSRVAAPSSLNDPLLDRLLGAWVLRGEIAGRQVTHSVKAQWVLGHEYVQIRETSQSKTAAGAPEYDAIVYIGWNPDLKQYTCLWLDSTGGNGLVGTAFGHANREASRLSFVFSDENGDPSLHNIFEYDRISNSWRWTIDNVDKDRLQPFARVKLTRE